MQEIKKTKRAVALFVIVLICLCGWWAVRKEGLFLDEIYSYGLANSSYVPFLSWLHGGEQVANGKLPEAVFTQSEFLNYVAPQEAHGSTMRRSTITRHRTFIRRCSTFCCTRCAHYFRAALQNGRVWG